MTAQLIIVSHALTDWNLKGRIQGHTDVPLNPMGWTMARQLGKTLLHEKLDAVYTSDLIRAYQTAVPTAKAQLLTIKTDSGLREGRTFRQLASPIYPTLPFSTPIETRPMALKRITKVLSRIAQNHETQTVLVVTHAAILDIFINSVLIKTRPLTKIRTDTFNGIRMALNRLRYDAGDWHCTGLNQESFLKHR